MSDTNSTTFSYVPPAAPEKVAGDVSAHPVNEALSASERISAQAGYIIAQGGGVFGNMADLHEGEILLPSFVIKKPDWYYLDLSVLEKNPRAFYEFADRTFSSGAYLFKLDYSAFSKITHHPEQALEIKQELESKGVPAELRFATDIIRISDERRPLYRTVQVSARLTDAQYFFEPVFIDKPVSRFDASGAEVVTIEQQKAKLDFDEFVAHLWKNGVRYGLCEKEIRAAIDTEPQKSWRVTVAVQVDPVEWTDATTVEATKKLRQDKSPKIHSDGRVDLSQLANFFPQIEAEEELLEKIPRKLGEAGMNVWGVVIEPAMPKDFDFSSSSWPGTKIVNKGGREFIVAAMNGYVNVDPKTNTISVSEKVVHHGGIDARVTGKNLVLEGAIEEKSDVNEGTRTHSPSSIWAKQHVYGTLESDSWVVEVDGNLIGGKIFAKGEDVQVKWKTSNARIDARNATVVLTHADGSIIIGKKVVLESARNCVIIAEEADIGFSAGSAIGTKFVKIWSSWGYRGEPTVVTLEIPNLEELGKPLKEVSESLEAKESERGRIHRERQENGQTYQRLASDEKVQEYMELEKKLRGFLSKWGTLTQDQKRAFAIKKSAVQKGLDAVTEAIRKNNEFKSAIEALDAEIAPLVMLKQEYEREFAKCGEGISVAIGLVSWETIVRTRVPSGQGIETATIGKGSWEKVSEKKPQPVRNLADIDNPVELRKEASSPGLPEDRKFYGSSGTFSWTYSKTN